MIQLSRCCFSGHNGDGCVYQWYSYCTVPPSVTSVLTLSCPHSLLSSLSPVLTLSCPHSLLSVDHLADSKEMKLNGMWLWLWVARNERHWADLREDIVIISLILLSSFWTFGFLSNIQYGESISPTSPTEAASLSCRWCFLLTAAQTLNLKVLPLCCTLNIRHCLYCFHLWTAGLAWSFINYLENMSMYILNCQRQNIFFYVLCMPPPPRKHTQTITCNHTKYYKMQKQKQIQTSALQRTSGNVCDVSSARQRRTWQPEHWLHEGFVNLLPLYPQLLLIFTLFAPMSRADM